MKFSFIWVEFFVFLKKHVNFVKLRIANIEKKFHFLKQRSEQTIFQLIVYLKAFEWQWFEILSNSVRVNSLIQALHDYIKKKLGRKKIDMFNRKTVKKVAMIIENIEKKSTHFWKNKKDQKTNDSKKRKRIDDVFDKKSNDDRFNAFTEFNKNAKKNKNDKKNKKRNLSKITCYNCQKKNIIKMPVLMSKRREKIKIVKNFFFFAIRLANEKQIKHLWSSIFLMINGKELFFVAFFNLNAIWNFIN